ncbi:fasciclin domain-containing protein [Streptomyces oceani]|uniref:Fasciclin n=1 Tax=Streptomyces oceani TaxID=1075402 RepID=A0A1E7KJP1_9ACTN|nr:fasciclin domain-containing protein [Streptomyces oceani]OEV04178.1 fasciclin [Streptomyces oceani]
MNKRFRRTTVAVLAAVVLPVSMSACSDDGDSSSNEGSDSKKSQSEKSGDSSGSEKGEDAQAMDGPFGPGCATVPESGKGSFDGMAKDPVATAASNNPELSTLTGAVKKAGLVDTLNNAKDITVFAPTNAAFEKIPKKDLDAVMSDKKKLTDLLTYHVVGERLTPEDLEKGSYETMQKDKLSTAGSGKEYTVNDMSKVVCGNVPTANATVYLVDSVLMPEK